MSIIGAYPGRCKTYTLVKDKTVKLFRADFLKSLLYAS